MSRTPPISFRKASLWFLLASSFLPVARAQYVIDSWTTENGLPQNSVLSIQQTLDGYLWFTTSDGLVRFDGVRFTVFNKGNSPGLTTNRFRRLFADKDGTLWACTEDQGLVRYRDGHFRAVATADGPAHDLLRRVQRDVDGSLLIENGLGASQHLRDGRLINDPHPDSEPYNIYISPKGARWDLDRTRLRLTMNGHQTSYQLMHGIRQGLGVVDAQMEETPDGALWLSVTGGLYRLKDGVATAYTAKEGTPKSPIWAMTQDQTGVVIATFRPVWPRA